MSMRNTMHTVVAAVACVVFTGCMPKMTIEEMKAMMPKRPVELDQLDAFVGTWEQEGLVEFSCLDQPLKISGRTVCKWEGDRWYLVSHCEMKMEHFDETKACETLTYDAKSKKYRSSWVDSMGMMANGESTYDQTTKTWRWKATNHSPWGQTSMKGTMRLVNDDTMEWSITESTGLTKVMDMSGTSKRVR